MTYLPCTDLNPLQSENETHGVRTEKNTRVVCSLSKLSIPKFHFVFASNRRWWPMRCLLAALAVVHHHWASFWPRCPQGLLFLIAEIGCDSKYQQRSQRGPSAAYQLQKQEKAKKELVHALSSEKKSTNSARKEGAAARERRVAAAAMLGRLLSAVDVVEGSTSLSPEKKKPKTNAAFSATLATLRRGEKPTVTVRAAYNSTQHVYDFDGEHDAMFSICALGEMIKSGALKVSALKKKNFEGDPLYGVPCTTMRRWIADDHKTMAIEGRRGKIQKSHVVLLILVFV
jgi:hypothetical protein